MPNHLPLSVLAAAFVAVALPAQQPTPAPATPAPAAPTPTPAPTPAPTAEQAILQRSLQFLQNLPTWRCKAIATFLMPELPPELANQVEIEAPAFGVEIVVGEGNRFALRSEEPFAGEVVCNGKQLLRSVDEYQLASVGPAPKDLTALLAAKQGAYELPAIGTLRALLGRPGQPGALIDAQKIELRGDEKILAFDCQHFVVLDEKLACDVWIAKGDTPWVLRHKPKPPKLDLAVLQAMGGEEPGDAGGKPEKGGKGETPEQPAKQEKQEQPAKPEPKEPSGGAEPNDGATTIQLETTFDLEFSDFAKDVGKEAFAVDVPEGFEKVDDLGKAIEKKMMAELDDVTPSDSDQQPTEEAAPGKLVGKPAPEAEFAMLDGSKLQLASLRGKVVLLDFWATWCQPCVAGLPELAAVAGKLADQGVVFVAVNCGEGKDTITKFLTEKKLALQVAFGDEKLSAKFGVKGIPHTVVLGRDGIVRSVHVGHGPGAAAETEQALRKALDAKAEAPGEKKVEPAEPKK